MYLLDGTPVFSSAEDERITRAAMPIESEYDWQCAKEIFAFCESEPELVLLKALVIEAQLRTYGPILYPTGKDAGFVGHLSVELQAVVGHYRLDFLITSMIAVEVDGRQYHSATDAFIRDRKRDQDLLLEHGIVTVRFPASQVYQDPVATARKIIWLHDKFFDAGRVLRGIVKIP